MKFCTSSSFVTTVALIVVSYDGHTVTAQDFDTGACTPCAQGTTPVAETQNPACVSATLESSVSGMIGTDTTCLNQQLIHFQTGCCLSAPYGYCTVCPDGSTPPGLENDVPTGEFVDNPTCNEWQFQQNSLTALFTDGDCSDTFLQRASFYCGCPGVEQECWLCPDKSPPGNPDRGEAWATNANCRGLDFLFSTFKGDECSTVPELFGINFAAFCLCPGVEEPVEEQCSLCPNGSLLNPDAVYTAPGATFERKCSQAEEFAKFILDGRNCDALLLEARETCQCSGGAGVYHMTKIFTTIVAGVVVTGAMMVGGLLW